MNRCKKKGHKLITRRAIIRKRSNTSVCKDYCADITSCIRWGCDYQEEPKNLVYKTYWTSVSMPDSEWDKLDSDGFLFIRWID